MKKIRLVYTLDDDLYQRLEIITEHYNKHGLDIAADKMFHDIIIMDYEELDKKFAFHEWKLGLKEEFPF